MRVLVGCEFSGVVREAFRSRGHDAMSCDLLPTEIPGPHYVGDVRDLFGEDFDLFIAFPPCTYLTAAAAWINRSRIAQQMDALAFFKRLYGAPFPRVALENPKGAVSSLFMLPDQVIQPWQFGHGETKTTCLWLRGLPRLKPTNVVEGRAHRINNMAATPDRWKRRSRTYAGIAEAMADQWGAPAKRIPLLEGG